MTPAALRSKDFVVRGEAMKALARMGDAAPRAEIVALLDDPDPVVRLMAAQTLGCLEIETARALEVVLPLAREAPRIGLRHMAIAALEHFSAPPESLVPELVRGLEAVKDPGMIDACKRALVAVGGPAVPALVEATASGSEDLRRRARAVLCGILDRYDDCVGEVQTRDWIAPAFRRVYAERVAPYLAQLPRE